MTLDKQLHPQLLLLPHGGELGGAVVDQLVGAAVAGQAGNVDQVVLLVADHVRQEGFDGPEVYHDVHVERPDDFLVGCVQQSFPGHDTRIVNQDGDLTNLCLGLLGCYVDFLSTIKPIMKMIHKMNKNMVNLLVMLTVYANALLPSFLIMATVSLLPALLMSQVMTVAPSLVNLKFRL